MENVDVRETPDLIASDKVEGTEVYSTQGDHIGAIDQVLIDKQTGHVGYAVLSFGGFLGIGKDHYPLPWEKLTYDTELGGYRVDVTKEQLEGAPKYDDEDDDGAWYTENGRRVNEHYGVTPYGM